MHGGGATQDLNSREALAMYVYINHRRGSSNHDGPLFLLVKKQNKKI